METIYCISCDSNKDKSCFTKQKKKCDECVSYQIKERKKKYRQDNKEKIKEQQKKYREENKDKIKELNKKYRQENKEKIKEQQKKYYEDNKEQKKKYREENKEKLKELNKKYYEDNKEQIKEQKKKYREENKEKIKELNKNYYEENKDKIKEYQKKHREDNKEKVKERENKYKNNRYRTDINFRVSKCIRRSIYRMFIGGVKTGKSMELLGCDINFIIEHLESQFTDEMNWENHGDIWHIDHIKPMAKFNNLSTCPIEQRLCSNWRNLQPLLVNDNLEKSDKWDDKLEDNIKHEEYLLEALKYLEVDKLDIIIK